LQRQDTITLVNQGRANVLERLSDHIHSCYERAQQAEQRAGQEDESQKFQDLQLAKWWTHLARSYEFIESLERFLLETDAEATEQRERKQKQGIWVHIAAAPYDRDLRLAVLDTDGAAHALVFPCRRILGGWVKSQSKERLSINPTHWQEWSEDV
jgi:hypothetical protein